jgi:hypothetical protein
MLYCIYNIALAGHAVNREVYGVRRGLFRSKFKGPKSNVMKKMFKVQGFKSSRLKTIEQNPTDVRKLVPPEKLWPCSAVV